MPSDDKPFEYTLRAEVASERAARVVAAALDVDAELKPDVVARSVRADGAAVVAEFAASEPRGAGAR